MVRVSPLNLKTDVPKFTNVLLKVGLLPGSVHKFPPRIPKEFNGTVPSGGMVRLPWKSTRFVTGGDSEVVGFCGGLGEPSEVEFFSLKTITVICWCPDSTPNP